MSRLQTQGTSPYLLHGVWTLELIKYFECIKLCFLKLQIRNKKGSHKSHQENRVKAAKCGSETAKDYDWRRKSALLECFSSTFALTEMELQVYALLGLPGFSTTLSINSHSLWLFPLFLFAFFLFPKDFFLLFSDSWAFWELGLLFV